jgi:hypothetical protein
MARFVRDWRIDLVQNHPDLFHPLDGASASQGYPECGEGWRDLLERACVRIEAAIAGDGTVWVRQIKEKFGNSAFLLGRNPIGRVRNPG